MIKGKEHLLEGLHFLRYCNTQEQIEQCFSFAFQTRRWLREKETDKQKTINNCFHYDTFFPLIENTNISEKEAANLLESIQHLVFAILQESSDLTQLAALMYLEPILDIDKRLKDIIVQVLCKYHCSWREASARQSPSIPKYMDLSWKLNLTTSLDCMKKASEPSAVLGLTIQDQEDNFGMFPNTRSFFFEVDKETLDVMLEGLNKIKCQIDSL